MGFHSTSISTLSIFLSFKSVKEDNDFEHFATVGKGGIAG
jgi:hypothetical protein